MIRINLLSPGDKSNIKWEKTNRLATCNFAIAMAVQVFFVFILLATIGYLGVEEKKLNTQLGNMQLGSEVREINLIKGEVVKYNSQLNDILEVQEKQFYWVKILDDFSKTVPYGISINNISIDSESSNVMVKDKAKRMSPQNSPKDFKVIITGVSETTEDLLNFEYNLKNFDIFVDFNIDPKNYDGESFKYVLSIKKESVLLN